MAQYPTSVPSFSNKSAGETIQASHVTGLQDEVIAIADALKNGIPHAVTISTGGLTVSTGSVNVGGPSSLATLQVNQGSTFSSNVAIGNNLQVTGASTFTGNVTIGGSLTLTAQPRAAVTHASTQTVGDGAWAGTVFDTELYDVGGMHSSTSGESSRLTMRSSGLYMIGCAVELVNSSNFSRARLVINAGSGSSIVLAEQGVRPIASTIGGIAFSASYYAGSSGDYATLETWGAAGMQVSSGNSTARSRCLFWAHRVI